MKYLLYPAFVVFIFSCNNSETTISNKKDSTSKETSKDQKTNAFRPDTLSNGKLSTKYSVQVFGTARDMVRFFNNGVQIGTDGDFRPDRGLDVPRGDMDNIWQNGNWNTGCLLTPCTNLDVKRAENDGIFYTSVRHGDLRDLVFFYAVVNDSVYRSKEWRDIKPGHPEHGTAIDHIGNSIRAVGDDQCTITFDPRTRKFSYEKTGVSDFSPDANRQETVLKITQ